MSSIPLKTCTSCGQAFPATKEYFHTRNASPDKLSYICKECGKLQGRDWHERNREHANQGRRERHRKSREGQPVLVRKSMPAPEGFKFCLDCGTVKPATREHFHANKNTRDGLVTYCKTCACTRIRTINSANPQKNIDRVRNWRDDHPAEYKIQNKILKARRRNAGKLPTKRQLRDLYAQSDDHCSYCGIRLFGEYHLEHMLPVARGGSNDLENLAVVCADCNLSKGDKTLDEWATTRGW